METNSGNTTPNSPFCQRPIFLCAVKEIEANTRQLMADIINPDTDKLKNEGFNIPEIGHVSVDITRSMFDGKMSEILSGAGVQAVSYAQQHIQN